MVSLFCINGLKNFRWLPTFLKMWLNACSIKFTILRIGSVQSSGTENRHKAVQTPPPSGPWTLPLPPETPLAPPLESLLSLWESDCSGTSCLWGHTVLVLSCLAYFTQHAPSRRRPSRLTAPPSVSQWHLRVVTYVGHLGPQSCSGKPPDRTWDSRTFGDPPPPPWA